MIRRIVPNLVSAPYFILDSFDFNRSIFLCVYPFGLYQQENMRVSKRKVQPLEAEPFKKKFIYSIEQSNLKGRLSYMS